MQRLGKLAILRLCTVMAVAGAVSVGITAVAGAAPTGRAYELVSPIDKNGGDVMAQPARTRVASDGNTAGFISLTGFADVAGMGVAAEYLSRREGLPNTSGWTTHSTLPPGLDPMSLNAASNAMDTLYMAEFSDDFSKGILRTFTNFAGDPDIAGITSLYIRDDLDEPGAGSFDLLSDCSACTGLLRFYANPEVLDSTPDMGHVIFESRYKLTADAPDPTPDCVDFNFDCQPHLYEWDHGTLRAAAVLPASEGGGVAPRSVGGSGQSGPRYALRTISDDGSRIFFMVPPTADDTMGRLYMRENNATTVRINTTERTVPDSERPAEFETASADGSKAFFLTQEQLTDDDTNPSTDLYVYDASLPATDPNNLTLVSADEEDADGLGHQVDGVLGASDDGSYVYFAARGQLVDGGPPVTLDDSGIFAWHNGTITYVGKFVGFGDLEHNLMGRSYGTGLLGSRVTPDGQHLLFSASNGAGLTGYQHTTGNPGCGLISSQGSCGELYVYSAATDELACASCNPSNAPATTDASFNLAIGTGGSGPASHLSRPISADGSLVFFTTAERLLTADRNGSKRDVYAFDTTNGTLELISSGRSLDDSYFLDASSNGSDVFFVTRERLVGWDTDNGYDLYDARVGGGFPEPQVPAAECSGDACQGAVQAPPAAAPPASRDFFSGIGDNVKPKKPAKKCKKGKVRKRVDGKVKCVKKKKAAKKQGAGQRRSK